MIHFLGLFLWFIFSFFFFFCSFIAVENTEKYCVLISSKAVYFLKIVKDSDYTDRDAVFLEIKYDDLYHCLVSKDHGKVYVQLTKKAVNTSSGVAIPGPSQQKPMVRIERLLLHSCRVSFPLNTSAENVCSHQCLVSSTAQQWKCSDSSEDSCCQKVLSNDKTCCIKIPRKADGIIKNIPEQRNRKCFFTWEKINFTTHTWNLNTVLFVFTLVFSSHILYFLLLNA